MNRLNLPCALCLGLLIVFMMGCSQKDQNNQTSGNQDNPQVVSESASADKGDKGVLRHVVLFKFKDSSSVEDVKAIEDAFRKLPERIDEILDFEWGTDVSVENISRGYTHCFFVTFKTEEDRAIYLPHPAHKEFTDLCGPHIDQVLVFDYFSKE